MHAAQVLSGSFSKDVIDKYNVFAEAIDPEKSEEEFEEVSHEWLWKHTQTSQYCLHIVKCEDSACCKLFRSNVKDILKTRSLPLPLPL
jgi:hypothetical protein